MKRVMIGLTVGLMGAVILAEFLPNYLNSGFLDSMAADFNGPFSGYRNELAGKYMLWGGIIGAALGLLWDIVVSRKAVNRSAKKNRLIHYDNKI